MKYLDWDHPHGSYQVTSRNKLILASGKFISKEETIFFLGKEEGGKDYILKREK